jgi:hypothetical protein
VILFIPHYRLNLQPSVQTPENSDHASNLLPQLLNQQPNHASQDCQRAYKSSNSRLQSSGVVAFDCNDLVSCPKHSIYAEYYAGS